MSEQSEPDRDHGQEYAQFYGKKFALLIGSSKFPKDPERLPELQCPLEDIKGLNEVLSDTKRGAFDVIRLLPNEESFRVLELIEEKLNSSSTDDQIVIYYSGHGWTDFNGELYLTFSNTDTEKLRSTAIKFAAIYEIIKDPRVQAKQIVVILDCCYAGAVSQSLKGGNVEQEYQRLERESKGTIVLAATGENGTAKEGKTGKYSIYTELLLNGIKSGEADTAFKGYITVSDISTYVEEKLSALMSQKPEVYSLKKRGHIVLAKSGRTQYQTAVPAASEGDVSTTAQDARKSTGIKIILVYAEDMWEGGWTSAGNVTKLMSLRADSNQFNIPQIVIPVRSQRPTVSAILGGTFGFNMLNNVRRAYKDLANNYSDGDRVFLFGSSRGATTVLALSSLIGLFGIPRRVYNGETEEIIRLFGQGKRDFRKVSELIEAAECRRAEVAFLGLWDTIGSLGVPDRRTTFLTQQQYKLHDIQLSPAVRAAYHALAIDENRQLFAPFLLASPDNPQQILQQTWFSGTHANIGGGSSDTGLSDVALMWMIEKAKEHGLGVDDELIERTIEPDPLGVIHKTRSGAWRFMKKQWRKIGSNSYSDATESIHKSVITRYEVMADMPPNLREYYEVRADMPPNLKQNQDLRVPKT